MDDIVDTLGTLYQADGIEEGAWSQKVVAYIPHPVLSGKALENINNSSLDGVDHYISIPVDDKMKNVGKSVSSLATLWTGIH